MAPIRVLHVIPHLGIGGAELQLRELIVNSPGSRVVHSVLFYSDSKDEEGYRLYRESGIRFDRVPRSKLRPVRFLRKLAGAIRDEAPDIVHCWLYSGVIWGRWGAMLAGAKNIIVAHRGTYLPRIRILRINELLTARRVHFLTNSRGCAMSVSRQLHVPPNRFRIVRNGVDFQRFQVPPARKELRAELGIPGEQRLVTMVGRLTEAKNYPMLLRIARRCKGTLPVRFLVVGHGELRSDLLRLAERLEVNDVVHFLGLRSDIPRILRSSDMFCYTSNREGFPNALVEAMASGLPIVTTKFEGADELIQDGSTGVVVEMDRDEAGFLALRRYLDDPDFSRKCAANAVEFSRREFSMGKMVGDTIAFYEDILNGSRG